MTTPDMLKFSNVDDETLVPKGYRAYKVVRGDKTYRAWVSEASMIACIQAVDKAWEAKHKKLRYIAPHAFALESKRLKMARLEGVELARAEEFVAAAWKKVKPVLKSLVAAEVFTAAKGANADKSFDRDVVEGLLNTMLGRLTVILIGDGGRSVNIPALRANGGREMMDSYLEQ